MQRTSSPLMEIKNLFVPPVPVIQPSWMGSQLIMEDEDCDVHQCVTCQQQAHRVGDFHDADFLETFSDEFHFVCFWDYKVKIINGFQFDNCGLARSGPKLLRIKQHARVKLVLIGVVLGGLPALDLPAGVVVGSQSCLQYPIRTFHHQALVHVHFGHFPVEAVES